MPPTKISSKMPTAPAADLKAVTAELTAFVTNCIRDPNSGPPSALSVQRVVALLRGTIATVGADNAIDCVHAALAFSDGYGFISEVLLKAFKSAVEVVVTPDNLSAGHLIAIPIRTSAAVNPWAMPYPKTADAAVKTLIHATWALPAGADITVLPKVLSVVEAHQLLFCDVNTLAVNLRDQNVPEAMHTVIGSAAEKGIKFIARNNHLDKDELVTAVGLLVASVRIEGASPELLTPRLPDSSEEIAVASQALTQAFGIAEVLVYANPSPWYSATQLAHVKHRASYLASGLATLAKIKNIPDLGDIVVLDSFIVRKYPSPQLELTCYRRGTKVALGACGWPTFPAECPSKSLSALVLFLLERKIQMVSPAELRELARPPTKVATKKKSRTPECPLVDTTAMPVPDRVPGAIKPKFDSIVALTDAFCDLRLSDEYKTLIRSAVAALARKRPSPLLAATPAAWAAGITHAIGTNNFLYDKAQTPHCKIADVYAYFNVSAQTGQTKSKAVRETLGLRQLSPEWALPSRIADPRMFWLI